MTSDEKKILTSRPEVERLPVEIPKPLKPGHRLLISEPDPAKQPIDNRPQVPAGKTLL